ncbi:YceD family protein [Brevibacillus ruminantium]|uniref:YceD family protein n=1 Tax=Brevibacillus ruminantium TaxID=2950604 RepID=A0ABY4WKW4_9BACL|nr:YceD family protein [Brevibacillus ruminantium]USG67732.1 YceD family protein [Brevibacillus ruminantium]
MNIKIADLEHRKGEPLRFQLTLDADELKRRHQEIRGLTPVQTSGEAAKLGDLYYVNGNMQADVDFVCSRCLRPFKEHVEVPFSETFAEEGSELIDDEDSEILSLEGDEIELVPLLQENFLLDIPSFPLCTDDCQGLCPTCGVNRNEQACSCKNERIDPRLAGLADFFKDSQ